jgi:hypothetical protein
VQIVLVSGVVLRVAETIDPPDLRGWSRRSNADAEPAAERCLTAGQSL